MAETREISIGDAAGRAAGAEDEFHGEQLTINMGPSHPATHGVLRLMLELDGETVTKCDPVIGYLHRGDEKIAENMTYNQFVPYTDRLDYIGPIHNNVTYAIAVESGSRLEMPPRCQAIRLLCCELSRLRATSSGSAPTLMDCGALTVFLYTFTEREKLYTLISRNSPAPASRRATPGSAECRATSPRAGSGASSR
jgi:NADH-quinone oxidoreductase subunit D